MFEVNETLEEEDSGLFPAKSSWRLGDRILPGSNLRGIRGGTVPLDKLEYRFQ